MLYRAYVKASEIPIDQRLEEAVDAIHPIDWPRVIDELAQTGVSMRKVSLIVAVAQPTVKGWYDGSIPNYEAGAKLLEAHAVATGRPTPVKRPESAMQPIPSPWPG